MSKIIRGQARVLRKTIVDANQQAVGIIQQAESEAARIVAVAEQTAKALQIAAETQGRARGYAEVARLLQQAHAAKANAIDEARDSVLALSIKAAEKLLRSQLALDPNRIQHIVDDLVDRTTRASRLALRIHPEDVPHVQVPERNVEIIEDATLERGECILETNLGDLDARFSVQLKALGSALVGTDD